MKKITFALVLLISTLILFSCNTKKEEAIVFDDSYPLALAPDVSWAVITEPYVAFKKDMSWDAEVTTYCRKGEILQVIGTSVDKQKQTWYRFENGWVPSSSLSVYSNRLKAQKIAASLAD